MKSRGFTIVELLVTLVILAVVLLMVTGFFRSQSRMAMDSKAAKAVNEEVGGALGMIAADLRKMGTGLGYLTPEVGASLYVAAGDLQVNWTGWYDYDAIPTTSRGNLPAETVYLTDASLDPAKVKSGQKGLKVPNIVNVPKTDTTISKFIGGDFGGLIGLAGSTSSPIPLSSTNGSSATGVNYGYTSTPDTCTATPVQGDPNFKTIFFDGFTGAYDTVTPSITYRLIPTIAGPPAGGQLLRNWVPILGDPLESATVRGGIRGLEVTAFTVTLRFVNSLGAQKDQPDAGQSWSTATQYSPPAGYTLKDLKRVTVLLRYQWRIPGTQTRTDLYTSVMRSSFASIAVAPRCIVKAASP